MSRLLLHGFYRSNAQLYRLPLAHSNLRLLVSLVYRNHTVVRHTPLIEKDDEVLGEDEEGEEAEEESGHGPFVNPKTGEVGGPRGPEPTRYGDWEKGGRISDF